MDTYWILVPLAVAASSLVLIDGRGWRRPLGIALLLGGLAGTVTTTGLGALAAERDAARCASLGGTPVSGECWIKGERQ